MAEKNEALPRHIAFIMDGNGRWAKKRGLPRRLGHRAGAQTFRNIVLYCRDLGIELVTVYAFSTENWKRPKDEVEAICTLLDDYLEETGKKLEKERVRLRFLGEKSAFSPELQHKMEEMERRSAVYEGCCVNIAMNYGGRAELLRAARRLLESGLPASELSEARFEAELYTAGQPDPDLIIRPSGELRLSNFLLWQCAYSEFWFSDVLWPDFKKKHLDQALADYALRDRRFGDAE